MSSKNSKNTVTLLQKILVGILGVIFFIILVGTTFAFAKKKAVFGAGLRKTDPSPEQILKSLNKNSAICSDLGQLRLVTADMPPTTVILTPYFPYSTEDAAFFEEITQKMRKIKTIFFDYFSLRTRDELVKLGELRVKNEIISLINLELVLGSISTLYFEEYLFID